MLALYYDTYKNRMNKIEVRLEVVQETFEHSFWLRNRRNTDHRIRSGNHGSVSWPAWSFPARIIRSNDHIFIIARLRIGLPLLRLYRELVEIDHFGLYSVRFLLLPWSHPNLDEFMDGVTVCSGL